MNEYSSRSHTIFTIGIVICNISNGSGWIQLEGREWWVTLQEK
jgi:hypothetical protein